MNFILDLILVAIAAFFVLYGWKRGFFKSVMFFGSGVASLFLSYAFAPSLGKFIKDRFIIGNISQSIEKSFSSIARIPAAGAEGEYDLSLLAGDPQFGETVAKYGANEGKINDIMGGSGTAGDIIEKVSRAVADPVATTIGRIIAFIIIFIVSIILLRVLTFFIGFLFELPVLKTMDRTAGLIFGIVCAVFFVWIFSMSVDFVMDALDTITSGDSERPMLISFFAKYNPVGLLSGILGY